MNKTENTTKSPTNEDQTDKKTLDPDHQGQESTQEIGGRKGPEPTRYGDWENNGIASDF